MTDHEAEAAENLTIALTRPDGYQHLRVEDVIAIAQTNAMLAVAEQQRIGNLIAVWTMTEDDAVAAVKAGINFGGIITQIREGLGIA